MLIQACFQTVNCVKSDLKEHSNVCLLMQLDFDKMFFQLSHYFDVSHTKRRCIKIGISIPLRVIFTNLMTSRCITIHKSICH